MDELSPEKDQSLKRRHQHIAVRKEDMEADENCSEDDLDDVFGVDSQRPQQPIFALTDNEESQGLLEGTRPQVRLSVCYMLYVILYQYKEQLTIVDIELIEHN
jgi:hypothetical protein